MHRPRMRLRPDTTEEPVVFDPRALSGLFGPPPWLRDLGQSAWLAVGVALFVAAVIWLLAMTQTIVMPVITASVIAAVASPLVAWVARHVPGRGIAAGLVLLGMVVFVVVVILLVVGGISGQVDALKGELTQAKTQIASWLTSLGIDKQSAEDAVKKASSTSSSAVPALLDGIVAGLKSLSSLAFFLALTLLALFLLLLDGPNIRRWTERQMRVPEPVAHQMTQRVLQSLRGYFVGVTIIALFNAVVIGAGALVLGVPLVGTIALVTFLGAFIPYLGAWGAGIFVTLIALGGGGTDAAVGMIIVQLLANGILQQLVQPIAYGAALGIHPLAVLIVTIGGGALFGTVGLILAAPLTAAATRIAGDLSQRGDEQDAAAEAAAAAASVSTSP